MALYDTRNLVEPKTLPWWAWLAYALLVWEWRAGRFGPGTFSRPACVADNRGSAPSAVGVSRR